MNPLTEKSTPTISPSQLFANDQPIEVEIGCGKGKFLIARAEASPEINFIGIDWAKKWLAIGESRGQKKKLPNLIFIRGQAEEWIGLLPSQSIAVFHIYFPDPWPKRRHHRRRFVQVATLKILQEKLIAKGIVELATDYQAYFEHMKEAIASQVGEWDVLESQERIAHPLLKTNYEIKYASQGRPLYYLELRKK